MAKNKKKKEKKTLTGKRKTSQKSRTDTTPTSTSTPISSLCNVAGILESTSRSRSSIISDAVFPSSIISNELDDCLALMDQSIEVQQQQQQQHDPISNSEDGVIHTTSTHGSDAKRASETNLDEIQNSGQERNDSLRSKNSMLPGTKTKPNMVPKLPNDEMMLPNIQVELSRHLQMGELSKFLLKRCQWLRMPSVERWVIDSKLEEKEKRFQIQELNSSTGDFHKSHLGDNERHAKWKGRLKRKRLEMRSSLEMHLTSSGKRPMTEYDAVIPSMASIEDDSSRRLIEEIEAGEEKKDAGKLEKDTATGIVKELCQKACQSAKSVENLSLHLGGRTSTEHYFSAPKKRNSNKSNSIGRIHLEVNKENNVADSTISQEEGRDSLPISAYSLIYTRKNKSDKGKKMKPFVVKINKEHYEKLREMFNDNLHPSLKLRASSDTSSWRTDKSNPVYHIFNHIVFCLLLRYSSLSGGQQLQDLRGGGMQGAIHSQVFDALETKSLNVMECFASPFNAYTRHFCSVFHRDLDHHFGSVGDFFSIPLGFFAKHGHIHEANPPFAPGFMYAMVKRMEEHLKLSDSAEDNIGKNLTFVIVVPTVKRKETQIHDFSVESFNHMLESPYFSKHLILAAREHGYVEGSQHLRPTRYKQSQYDTSVIILQSKTAMASEKYEGNLTSQEFESKLRTAFSSHHLQELNERRKGNDNQQNENTVAKPTKRKSVKSTQGKKKRHKQ